MIKHPFTGLRVAAATAAVVGLLAVSVGPVAADTTPGGDASYSQNGSAVMCVTKLNANGSIFTSFGSNGRAIANLYGRGSFGRAFRVDLDSLGNLQYTNTTTFGPIGNQQSPSAVPLPASALGALPLLGLLVAARARRLRAA